MEYQILILGRQVTFLFPFFGKIQKVESCLKKLIGKRRYFNKNKNVGRGRRGYIKWAKAQNQKIQENKIWDQTHPKNPKRNLTLTTLPPPSHHLQKTYHHQKNPSWPRIKKNNRCQHDCHGRCRVQTRTIPIITAKILPEQISRTT